MEHVRLCERLQSSDVSNRGINSLWLLCPRGRRRWGHFNKAPTMMAEGTEQSPTFRGDLEACSGYTYVTPAPHVRLQFLLSPPRHWYYYHILHILLQPDNSHIVFWDSPAWPFGTCASAFHLQSSVTFACCFPGANVDKNPSLQHIDFNWQEKISSYSVKVLTDHS